MTQGAVNRPTNSVGSSPRPAIVQFSTNSVPKSERLDYWVGSLSETIFAMSTSTRSPADFDCSLASTQLDALSLTVVKGSNQHSFRTRRFVAGSSRQTFHLIADFRRPWVAIRNGQHIAMQPGDLIVTDTNEVHGGMWRDSCRVTNLLLPSEWLRAWVDRPDSLVGRRIDKTLGWGATLSSFICRLAPHQVDASPMPAKNIVDHIGVMLTMIAAQFSGSAGIEENGSTTAQKNLSKVDEVVRQRLGERALDADDVAHSLNIPVAIVHQWMTDAGTMFEPFLQGRRVSLASDMLSSRRFDSLSCAEIGRRVGVENPAQFTRLVRRHLGESPVGHRRASAC